MQTEPAAIAGIDEAFYRMLVESFTDWQNEDAEIEDAGLRDACRRLIEREARLLDQQRYAEWLALYTRQCLLWAPTTPVAGDPRREVCISFDDRRRLEDRIFRLKTGYAWSQVPVSRTVRMVSNVEVYRTREADCLMIRSNVLITEFRTGAPRTLAGWCGHRVVQEDGRRKIAVKQVNLIDCDQNLRNLSFIL